MLKKIRKILFAAVLLSVLASGMTQAQGVRAAESNVAYRGRAESFVFIPESTDLFQNFKNVMPGDVLTQIVKVANESTNIMPVRLYLRAEPIDPADKAFLEQLRLKVDHETSGTLSNDNAAVPAGLTSNVLLGTFMPGMDRDLEVRLEVPESMGNDFQNAIGEVVWVFTVEEDDPPPLPQTGEVIRNILLGAVLLLAGVAIIILLRLKRRKDAMST